MKRNPNGTYQAYLFDKKIKSDKKPERALLNLKNLGEPISFVNYLNKTVVTLSLEGELRLQQRENLILK